MDSSPKHLDKFICSVTNHKMNEKLELEEVMIRPPPRKQNYYRHIYKLNQANFLTSYKKHTYTRPGEMMVQG